MSRRRRIARRERRLYGATPGIVTAAIYREPLPQVETAPIDEYSQLMRLYQVEGAEAVRKAYTVEELRRLSRLYGFEVGRARTKADLMAVLLG